MAYSDIQQTEFNRATENLIEITWTYVNLSEEFPRLNDQDSMSWKQMFITWANEFESLLEDWKVNGEVAWCQYCKKYVQVYDEEIEKCPVCGAELED